MRKVLGYTVALLALLLVVVIVGFLLPTAVAGAQNLTGNVTVTVENWGPLGNLSALADSAATAAAAAETAATATETAVSWIQPAVEILFILGLAALGLATQSLPVIGVAMFSSFFATPSLWDIEQRLGVIMLLLSLALLASMLYIAASQLRTR